MVKMNQMLSEKVADQILKMITVDKKFNIGDKLPNENELSSELGVSRTTLREAVKFLIAHNVLEIKRGKGTFVADNSELNEDYGLSDLDNLAINGMDFFETRIMLEPTMTSYAALRATKEDIEELCRIDELINQNLYDVEKRTQYDIEFHYAISRATKNEFIILVAVQLPSPRRRIDRQAPHRPSDHGMSAYLSGADGSTGWSCTHGIGHPPAWTNPSS